MGARLPPAREGSARTWMVIVVPPAMEPVLGDTAATSAWMANM